jgi:hypothetical protein
MNSQLLVHGAAACKEGKIIVMVELLTASDRFDFRLSMRRGNQAIASYFPSWHQQHL